MFLNNGYKSIQQNEILNSMLVAIILPQQFTSGYEILHSYSNREML